MFFRAVSGFVAVLALAPFAFAIACGPKKPDSPPTVAAPVEPASSSTPLVAESSSAPPASPPPSDASPPTSPPFVDARPEIVLVEGPCKEMNAANRFVREHRTCGSDAECEVVTPGCACAVGVQRSVAAEAKQRHDAAYSACIAKNLPMPCATCGPAPSPRCAAGMCRP